MKSIAVFRRVLISSQILSPLMGSSAFVLGMRHRERQTFCATTRTTAVPHNAMATSSTSEKDHYEIDFIAAATQAATEREAREPPQRIPTTYYNKTPTPAVDNSIHSDEYEYEFDFDFLAAATEAAVERESHESNRNDNETTSFKVYPAFRPPSNVFRPQTKALSEASH